MLEAGLSPVAVSAEARDPLTSTGEPRWLVTCPCGWGRECLSAWAAESVAKLHPKLGEPGTVHTVRIEEPPDEPRREPELPLA